MLCYVNALQVFSDLFYYRQKRTKVVGEKLASKMKLNDSTALARPIDLNYPTNKAIVLLSLLVLAASTLVWLATGQGLPGSVWRGLSAGLAVFLSWALARELDPEYDLSAFVTAGFALLGLIFFDGPEIIVLLWILLVTRVVNRTSGLPARLLDSLVLLALAGWLTIHGTVIVGLMTSLAFLLDGVLSRPKRAHVLFACLPLLISGGAFYLNGSTFGFGENDLSRTFALAVVVLSLLFLLVIFESRNVRAVADQTAELLDPVRVQSAQVVALATAVVVSLLEGLQGIVSIMPLWAAIAGTLVYRVFILAQRSFHNAG